MFIQSFEQSNLKQLNSMTPVRLVQLVDANDVNPDGSLDYTAPFDRPYDWTVSGDPLLLARTFGFFATDAGLGRSATYADGIGPWKRYIVSSVGGRPQRRRHGRPTRTVTARVDEADRALAPPTDLIRRAHKARAADPHLDVPQRAAASAADYGGNPVHEYLQFYRARASTACSPTSRTPALTARRIFRALVG